jgi:hypothetical protein
MLLARVFCIARVGGLTHRLNRSEFLRRVGLRPTRSPQAERAVRESHSSGSQQFELPARTHFDRLEYQRSSHERAR